MRSGQGFVGRLLRCVDGKKLYGIRKYEIYKGQIYRVKFQLELNQIHNEYKNNIHYCIPIFLSHFFSTIMNLISVFIILNNIAINNKAYM